MVAGAGNLLFNGIMNKIKREEYKINKLLNREKKESEWNYDNMATK
jgi:hypothetical protein